MFLCSVSHIHFYARVLDEVFDCGVAWSAWRTYAGSVPLAGWVVSIALEIAAM